jgi:hypothetical protein
MTAASFVPHCSLSGAKISIIHETSKLFTNYFSFDTKITDADYQKPASETYRVLTISMLIMYYQLPIDNNGVAES